MDNLTTLCFLKLIGLVEPSSPVDTYYTFILKICNLVEKTQRPITTLINYDDLQKYINHIFPQRQTFNKFLSTNIDDIYFLIKFDINDHNIEQIFNTNVPLKIQAILLNVLLESKYFIFQIKDVISLYLENPQLRKYIKYKPGKHELEFILINYGNKELIDKLFKNGYYSWQIIDTMLIYLENPQLHEYIKYKPGKHELEFILINYGNKELIDKLFKNGYYSWQIIDTMLIYLENPQLHEYIKYKPGKLQLEFILINYVNKELIDKLLKNGYNLWQIINTMHLYLENPQLHEYIKYNLDKYELECILKNPQIHEYIKQKPKKYELIMYIRTLQTTN